MKALRSEYDVVVIGAGMGGLTCGASLAKAGMKVLVCEQHSVPGGYCTSFKRKGFTFETSIHWLNQCAEGGLIYQTLEELGIQDQIEFIQLDPVRRIIGKDYDLTVFLDTQRLEDDLKRMFPAEAEGIHQFITDCTTLAKSPEVMTQYLGKSSQQVFDYLFQDSKLKSILCSIATFPQWSVLPLMFSIGWFSEKDYYFPKRGGAQALAHLFGSTFQGYGGDLALKTMVKKIWIENGKASGVELQSGERIKSKYVVSNADARLTFLKLVGRELLDEEFIKDLLETEICPPVFLVSLGVDMDLGKMGFNGAMITYNPSAELADLSTADPSRCGITIIIYSLRDPSLAPPGKHTVSIGAMLPYEYMGNWGVDKQGRRGREYKKLKEQVADRLIASAENVIPGLSQHIVCKDIATPLTYERYTLNTRGAIMGWDLTPQNFMKMRPQDTPIKNLYQAGHWVFPGGGIPAVIPSGRLAAELILKESQDA